MIVDLSFEGTCSGKNNEGGAIEPGVIFFDGSSSYTTIKNCHIDYCGANGITLKSQYSTIDNNSINHITRIGIEGLCEILLLY
jgi:parallel beta-helix repeat protein